MTTATFPASRVAAAATTRLQQLQAQQAAKTYSYVPDVIARVGLLATLATAAAADVNKSMVLSLEDWEQIAAIYPTTPVTT